MLGNFVCGELTCTGCGACVDACPFNALEMAEVGPCSELAPNVDFAKCRECGRCHAVCPACAPIELRMPLKTYASWSSESSDVTFSSSGGLATALARSVIADGGIVFGTASIGGEARCIAVEQEGGLESLRGSKYVCSNSGGAYRSVKQLLAEGRKVLFVAVPCQIAALRAIAGDSSEGLISVDLICHGTPPISFLREHLNSKVEGTWDSFSFRGKNDFRMCAYRDGELVYDEPCFEDEYFSAFVAGVIHRDVCYECPYSCNQRAGDITLGDFWGLDTSTLGAMPPGKVSVVLCNTQKGADVLAKLPSSVYLEEREFSEADNEEQTNLHEPSARTGDRQRFLKAYEQVGFDSAVHKTLAWRRFQLRVLKHKVMGFVGR